MEALLGAERLQPTQLHHLARRLATGDVPDIPRGLLEADNEALSRGLRRALEHAEFPPRCAVRLAVALVAAQLRAGPMRPHSITYAVFEDVFGQVRRAAARFADHAVHCGAPHRAIAIAAALAAQPPLSAWTGPSAQAGALLASAIGAALRTALNSPAPGSAASLNRTWALAASRGLQTAVDQLVGVVTCRAHAAVAAPRTDPEVAAAAAAALAAVDPASRLAPRLALCACLAHPSPTAWGPDSGEGGRELRAFRALLALARRSGPPVSERPQSVECVVAASRAVCGTVDAAVDAAGPLRALAERGSALDAGVPTEGTPGTDAAKTWAAGFIEVLRGACGALLACTPLLPHVAAAACAAALRCALLAAADPEGGGAAARAALALAIVRCDAGVVRACTRDLARRIRARDRRHAAHAFAAGLLLEALEAGSSGTGDAGPELAYAVVEAVRCQEMGVGHTLTHSHSLSRRQGTGYRAAAVAVHTLYRSLRDAPGQGPSVMAAVCRAYPESVGAHSLGAAAAAVVRCCSDDDAFAAVETLGRRTVEAVVQARAHEVEARSAMLACADLAAHGRRPAPGDVRVPEATPSRAWRPRGSAKPSGDATWRDTPWLLDAVPFSTPADATGPDDAERAAAAALASRVASEHLEVSGRAHAATAVLATVLQVRAPPPPYVSCTAASLRTLSLLQTARGSVHVHAKRALEEVVHAWGPARRHHCTAVISHVALEQPDTPPRRRAAVATWLHGLVEGTTPAARL